MKLSEAIRIGAALHAACTDEYARYDNAIDDGTIRTCAMGAAFEAITGRVPFDDLQPKELLGYANEKVYTIYKTHYEHSGDPVCMVVQDACGLAEDTYVVMPDGTQRNWVSAIIYMNDEWGWEREAIAEYLEKRGF